MTIKKNIKAAPASGNGAVADRFRLDAPEPNAKPATSTASTVAAVVGLVALALVGILTYMLWQHWEFLMPA